MALESWPRPRYFSGGDEAWLLFDVFGEFAPGINIDPGKYRTRGLPEGSNLLRLEGEELEQLKRDWVEKESVGAPPDMHAAAAAAPSAMHVRVRVPDPRTLDYLRDTIGVVQALAETGGVAILGKQRYGWWTAQSWRERVFERGIAALVPELTVIIHSAEEKGGGLWVHTRGMRQFGRPDMSIRNVPQARLEDAARLCNALNKVQVDGELIPEGQEIKTSRLPAGMTVHHAGDVEDPDFNNYHLEVRWPKE